MPDLTQNQLITELSRAIVTTVAPEELPLFRAQSEAYFKNPEKLLTAKPGKDAMLGFGAGEAVIFLTPGILAVMSSVVTFLSEEMRKALQEQTAAVITKVVKRLFKKLGAAAGLEDQSKEKEDVMSLTASQLQQVREIVLNRARQLKIAEPKADILANSIVGSLV